MPLSRSIFVLFPKIDSYLSALISPIPGLFTHRFSLVNFSPFLIGLTVTTVAKNELRTVVIRLIQPNKLLLKSRLRELIKSK